MCIIKYILVYYITIIIIDYSILLRRPRAPGIIIMIIQLIIITIIIVAIIMVIMIVYIMIIAIVDIMTRQKMTRHKRLYPNSDE